MRKVLKKGKRGNKNERFAAYREAMKNLNFKEDLIKVVRVIFQIQLTVGLTRRLTVPPYITFGYNS